MKDPNEAMFKFAAAMHKWLNEQINKANPKGDPSYRRGYFDALLDTKNKVESTFPTLSPRPVSTPAKPATPISS